MMSCARDNSLKQWVFDAVDGASRLLRFRSGHAAPPTVVRHYGSGRLLLSAGGLVGGGGCSGHGVVQGRVAAHPPTCYPASCRSPYLSSATHAHNPPPAAGQDRAFRAFSTIQDAQSRELSQHHTKRRAKRLKIEEQELKLTPVLALDACDVSARC